MPAQLAGLPAPALAVLDGEAEVTALPVVGAGHPDSARLDLPFWNVDLTQCRSRSLTRCWNWSR